MKLCVVTASELAVWLQDNSFQIHADALPVLLEIANAAYESPVDRWCHVASQASTFEHFAVDVHLADVLQHLRVVH